MLYIYMCVYILKFILYYEHLKRYFLFIKRILSTQFLVFFLWKIKYYINILYNTKNISSITFMFK